MGNTSSSNLVVIDFKSASSRFTKEETDEIKSAFMRLAKLEDGGTNVLSEKLFRHFVLLPFVPAIPTLLAKRIFVAFAQSKNAYLDFHDFFCGLCVLARGTEYERIKFAFKVYDLNEANYLTEDILIKFHELIREPSVYREEGIWAALAEIEEVCGKTHEMQDAEFGNLYNGTNHESNDASR